VTGGDDANGTSYTYAQLRAWWQQHTRSLYTFFDKPLLVTSASGARLYAIHETAEATGERSYLDFYNNVHQVRCMWGCGGKGEEEKRREKRGERREESLVQ
jgi:hypothetical protein